MNKQLNARPMLPSDTETIAAWLSSPMVGDAVAEEQTTKASEQKRLQRLLKKNAIDDCECGIVIEYSGKVLAFAHYMWINWVSRTAELDICINPTQGKRAFHTVSILPCIAECAFGTFNLEKIYSFIYSDNVKSLRLLTRFMPIEAKLDGYLLHGEVPIDVMVVGLLKEDYLQLSITQRYIKRR